MLSILDILMTPEFREKVEWARRVLAVRGVQVLTVLIEKDQLVISFYGNKSYKQLITNFKTEACINQFEDMVIYVLNNAGDYAEKLDSQIVIYRTMRSTEVPMAFFPEVPVEKDYITAFSLQHGFEVVSIATYQSKTKKSTVNEYKQLKHIITDVIYADTNLEERVVLRPDVLQRSWDYFAANMPMVK